MRHHLMFAKCLIYSASNWVEVVRLLTAGIATGSCHQLNFDTLNRSRLTTPCVLVTAGSGDRSVPLEYNNSPRQCLGLLL